MAIQKRPKSSNKSAIAKNADRAKLVAMFLNRWLSLFYWFFFFTASAMGNTGNDWQAEQGK